MRIGHTAVTWPNDRLEDAVAAIAAEGYWGTETFGWVLEEWASAGKNLYEELEKLDLELTGLYCHLDLIRRDIRRDEIDQVMKWVDLFAPFDSPIVVVGGKMFDRVGFVWREHARNVIETLNELAKRIADRGKACCFHPHTWTAAEKEEEIREALETTDAETVFFAPDVGQFAKGGADPLPLLRDYREKIRMVHLKDYIGGPIEMNEQGREIDKTGFLGYVPLGLGSVDLDGALAILEASGYDGYISAELDGNQWSATRYGNPMMSQAEAIRASKAFLLERGYEFKR